MNRTDPTACECGNAEAHRRSSLYPLPLCDTCWQLRQGRGMEGQPDPDTVVPLPKDGAVSWEFREPEAVGRPGCDLEIEIGGRIMYQQRPPTHTGGAYRPAPGHRTIRRELSEAMARVEVERMEGRATHGQADALRLRREGKSYAEIGERLGIGIGAVRERLRRATKQARKAAR
jgi:DNA-binding CsgD family transcriptional regulator